MRLNEVGQIVVEEWGQSEEMREEVILDAFVVMPNHLHGIVCIVPPDMDDISPRGYDLSIRDGAMRSKADPNDYVGTTGRSSLRRREGNQRVKGPDAQSLSSLMAGFKSAVTKRIN